MPSMSNYLENKLADLLFRGRAMAIGARTASWDTAPEVYVGLLTAAPSDTGGGTEVSGGSYARVRVPASGAPGDATWKGTGDETSGASAGTSGTVKNNAAVTFPAPTGTWGVVTHFGIYDASSGGNLLWWAALTASKTVNNGDPAPSFATDALTVQIDN